MERLAGGKLRFGEFELDSARRSLTRDGEQLSLSAKTFDLLRNLVENHGNIVTKDELLSRVWPGQFVEENNLTVQVAAIRKVLGQRKDGPTYITTIPGTGYSFVAEVQTGEMDDVVIEQRSYSRIVVEQSQEPATATSTGGNWKGRSYLVGAFVLLSAVAAGGFIWQRERAAAVDPFQKISIKRLTNSGKISNAALSPDGKLFAFTTGSPQALMLGYTSGSEPRELHAAGLNYRTLRFSPDSSFLYFTAVGKDHPKGALFRIPAFGGVVEKLRDGLLGPMAFAPEMDRFVYVKNDKSRKLSILVTSTVIGENEHEIVSRSIDHPFDAGALAWSPDGNSIAVGADSVAGGASESDVFSVDVSSGQVKKLTSDGFRTIQSAEWLGDGSGLVIVACQKQMLDNQVWHVSFPDGRVRQVNPDLSNYGAPLGVSADGKTLLTLPVQYLANIWIGLASRPVEAKQITNSAIGGRSGRLGVEWLPDGRIVFPAVSTDGHPLFIADQNGDGQRQLTPNGSIDLNPSVTGDGKTVVFGSNRSGQWEVWRVNLDGGDLRQLTAGGGNEMPAVSPDGRSVVFVSMRDGLGTIWRTSIDGGEPVRIGERAASWLRVSPDSMSIACGYEVDGKNKLAILDITDGKLIKYFDMPSTANLRYALRWTPDGTALTYRDWEGGYWRQNVTGGEPQKLDIYPNEKLFASSWSPDGKQFAFVRGQEIRDLVLIQNQP